MNTQAEQEDDHCIVHYCFVTLVSINGSHSSFGTYVIRTNYLVLNKHLIEDSCLLFHDDP